MEVLNARVTPKVASALRGMRGGQPLTSDNNVSGQSYNSRTVTTHFAITYRVGGSVIADQTVNRLLKFFHDWPKVATHDQNTGWTLTEYGERMFIDKDGVIYLMGSAAEVADLYKRKREEAQRNYLLKRNKTYPHCYLNPSLDMLVYADNYIEASLALHGYGSTGEPMLQIPTPQEPQWWLNKDKYIGMSVLLLGKPGNTVQYHTSRGELRSFTQSAAAFEGLNDRVQKLAAELTELGLPVPK